MAELFAMDTCVFNILTHVIMGVHKITIGLGINAPICNVFTSCYVVADETILCMRTYNVFNNQKFTN